MGYTKRMQMYCPPAEAGWKAFYGADYSRTEAIVMTHEEASKIARSEGIRNPRILAGNVFRVWFDHSCREWKLVCCGIGFAVCRRRPRYGNLACGNLAITVIDLSQVGHGIDKDIEDTINLGLKDGVKSGSGS
jgi:hypothetical protein